MVRLISGKGTKETTMNNTNTMRDTTYGSNLEAALSLMGQAMQTDEIRPERFLGDLIRDGAWVQRNPGKTFYWIVRASGTHIASDFNSAHMVARAFRDEPMAFYYFDGEELHGPVSELVPVYYTVLIPFSDAPTEWHPTESTGPFATLTRGSFKTAAEAHGWAASHLAGQSYSVKLID